MLPITKRLTILRILRDAQPYALPATQLQEELNRLTRPAVTPVEFAEHIGWLRDRAYIDFLPDALDPDNADARRWVLKEAGAAALLK